MDLNVRAMQLEDITLMIDYFMEADEAFLKGM